MNVYMMLSRQKEKEVREVINWDLAVKMFEKINIPKGLLREEAPA